MLSLLLSPSARDARLGRRLRGTRHGYREGAKGKEGLTKSSGGYWAPRLSRTTVVAAVVREVRFSGESRSRVWDVRVFDSTCDVVCACAQTFRSDFWYLGYLEADGDLRPCIRSECRRWGELHRSQNPRVENPRVEKIESLYLHRGMFSISPIRVGAQPFSWMSVLYTTASVHDSFILL